MRRINSTLCLVLLLHVTAFGQHDHYFYQRELKRDTSLWGKVILPNEVFGKVAADFSDLRIIGLTTENDTIEAPYLLVTGKEIIDTRTIDFKIFNTAHNKSGYYYTFEVPKDVAVNRITLDFRESNFDLHLTLEGSQNLNEWFHLVDDYRILSIKNEHTDYHFTTIDFPDSRYKYFRAQIKSNDDPDLLSAHITRQEITEGRYREYIIKSVSNPTNKQSNQTIIEVDLDSPVPISFFSVNVLDSFDYYRPITIQYLVDSTKTEKGFIYSYTTLYKGTINSIEKNSFKFSSTIAQRLKIIIDNQNNEPLNINGFAVKGYVHELNVRFTKQARYYLMYGNAYATKPHYDIERFTDKVPDDLPIIQLGEEQFTAKDEETGVRPLFENKIWLWGIMVILILVLGWFTLKMMQKK